MAARNCYLLLHITGGAQKRYANLGPGRTAKPEEQEQISPPNIKHSHAMGSVEFCYQPAMLEERL